MSFFGSPSLDSNTSGRLRCPTVLRIRAHLPTAAQPAPSLLRPPDALVFGAVNSGRLYERPTFFQSDIDLISSKKKYKKITSLVETSYFFMAPLVGLEPTTYRLTAGRSTN